MPPRDEELVMPFSWASSFYAFLLLAPDSIDMRFVQVAPPGRDAALVRSAGQERAIVLIHGLVPHPINNSNVATPDLSGWERPGSTLVTTLAPLGDVFALGYAQNAAIDDIAKSSALSWNVNRLRTLGYCDIVLIGHSAGGLIARYFVEDTAGGGGVTKVIQVSPPNGGSSWGKRTVAVRQSQEVFLTSLSKEARQVALRERSGKSIPVEVQFVCVLCAMGLGGDGVVRSDLQWTPDLQRQGVPALCLLSTHVTAMRSKAVAQRLAELVAEPQPRWSPLQISNAREAILGKEK
jgi:triacylglycerol esterase/lipase EstA (alpha/beta hydrolase family)